MPRQRWDDETRQEALDLYLEHGPAIAARMTGVKSATIRSWAHKAGLTNQDDRLWDRETLKRQSKMRAAELERHNAEFAAWMSKAQVERERTAVEHEQLLAAQITEMLIRFDGLTSREMKDVAISVGIFIDKLRLMQGESTERHEVITLGGVEASIRALEAELGRNDEPATSAT